MVKQKSPEGFIAQSQIGEVLTGKDSILDKNLANGALRLVEVNGVSQDHPKLDNNETRVAEVMKYPSLVGRGILAENPDFIDYDLWCNTIHPDDVPESYFELQKRIIRSQGRGDVEITPEMRVEIANVLAEDQHGGLSKWSEYLRGEYNRNTYPDWYKVYVWESVKKLGDFDKKKNRFDRRNSTTAGLYPEVDPEAVAYVYDKIYSHVIEGGKLTDQKLSQLLEGANFGRLYTHAIEEAGMAITAEQQAITKGTWKKYDQIDGEYTADYTFDEDGEASDRTVVDSSEAMDLAASLQGHRTGWCTAGNQTAAHQLSAGDFYVFYSDNGEGEYVVPRIAIRMEEGYVAEVRGIEPGQNLESNLEGVLLEKLSELPGGDSYFTKVENMRRVTEIDDRVQNGGELTAEDIVFLRFSGDIEGFGFRQDPRIDSLLEGRTSDTDLDIVLSSEEVNPTELANKLVEKGVAWSVANNLDKFVAAGANINPTELANKLVEKGYSRHVANNLDKFVAAGANINPTELANKLLESGYSGHVAYNLDKFVAAGANINPTELANKLLESGYSGSVAYNVDKFVAAGANPTELANKLVEKGVAWSVANNLDKFVAAGANINPTELVNRVVDEWVFDDPTIEEFIANNLDKFVAAGVSEEVLARVG